MEPCDRDRLGEIEHRLGRRPHLSKFDGRWMAALIRRLDAELEQARARQQPAGAPETRGSGA